MRGQAAKPFIDPLRIGESTIIITNVSPFLVLD